MAWIIGVVLIAPFLATVRQIAEHRDAEADCDTDFSQVPHGAMNRMFGVDPFSRYYGAFMIGICQGQTELSSRSPRLAPPRRSLW
jgi:hypothetical protein